MAGRRVAIPYKEMALKVVGPADVYLAARVQRLDMTTNIPTTDIDELGNPQHAGTTTDIPEVSATFQAYDVSVKLFAALTGNSAAAYPGAGVDISDLQDIDIIGVVKDATLTDYIKSVHLRKCRVESFTYTYSVDGESTEEYTATGSKKRWFKNDVVVDDFAGSPVTSPQTVTETPIQLKNGDYAMSVIVDGAYFEEVTGAPSTDEYQLSGTTLSFDDSGSPSDVVAVYHANPAGSNWSDVDDGTIPPAIRGKDVRPVIMGGTTMERVQSVTVRGTLPVERVEEMGNRDAVGYVTQVPQVTGDITVLDTDTELVSLFATGHFNPADTEFDICEFTVSGIELKVELLDPAEGCDVADASRTVLKTVRIPQITITSEGHTTNVGGNATQTFSFRSETGECIVYSGAYP
jgi:hypothetical protein